MIRFYCPDIESSPVLPESDSRHCIRVLRMDCGDEVEVVDGRGGLYRCTIAAANQHRALLDIRERVELPKVWKPEITIAIAPTKHMDRMEWVVEKLVEIGVDRIVPLLGRRSERKEIKLERLEKIAVSAMKQSLKAVLPEIREMCPVEEFLEAFPCGGSAGRQGFICYCDADTPRRLLSREYEAGRDVAVMIGPEGDFSPEEVAKALACGYMATTLGDNRLRTETAALVACDTIQILNQIKE